jgi:hypothetical protein
MAVAVGDGAFDGEAVGVSPAEGVTEGDVVIDGVSDGDGDGSSGLYTDGCSESPSRMV